MNEPLTRDITKNSAFCFDFADFDSIVAFLKGQFQYLQQQVLTEKKRK